ncbi:SUMF1/EgtB/PvdO family nonheme iron enzyme [Sphingobacterium paucimobilis]|uniref:Glycoside hydrolase n=1 Tax=Sphingobacterium paucimobilis HER1398 TaxID=1346330 RepID=U2HGS7_9SPHI|nr:SUMF1/EgtB/PvdO family nonheme iron enzyme [Sphingobacterium paucimobilis]ERJ60961.1 hypothetical protein M472_19590 [Sphingobacterium paucimobilis HER1398]
MGKNKLMKLLFGIVLIFHSGQFVYAQHVNSIGLEMVDISPGYFLMGSAGYGKDYDESPAHKVQLTGAFRIAATEITNKQYETFQASHRALRGKNGFSNEDDEAVIYVSYHDAVAFCEWLSKKEGKNYRLPTEAEWEYVCRAGTMSPYAIGDRVLPKAMEKNQVVSWDPKVVSLRVKQSAPNQWGIYDMHGNVEEWCLDHYGAYSDNVALDPGGYKEGIYRVTRGGSHNTPVEFLRSANRSALIPEDRTMFTGFRVVEVRTDTKLTFQESQSVNTPSNAPKKNWSIMQKPVFEEPISFVKTDSLGIQKGLFYHNHCPAVTWTPNGDLLVVWFSTDDEKGREMTVLSSRLKEGTTSWTSPSLFFNVPDRNMTGSSLFYDQEADVIYHTNGVEAAGTWKNLALVLRESRDNGFTWTSPVFVNPEHEVGNQVIAGMFKTAKGYLVQVCDATPTVRGGSILHISKDKGKTWSSSDKNRDLIPQYSEHGTGNKIAGIHAGVVELKDGRLLALGRDDNIKKDGKNYMPMSISDDLGGTWRYAASEFPPISSGQRLILKRLNEGALLLISFTDGRIDVEHRQGMPFMGPEGSYIGYGMYAAVSYDEGKTWPIKKLITDGKERYLYGGAFTGHFKMDQYHAEPKGYLALTQTPDNIIHLFSSALHYRFNLQWLTK